mmetsp:Transcript_11857/g.17679  ORF Transcript_11857/g.17679 Transcript_11857/m.17679 type:complete len:204 (-) Transcript_11857:474-1085(-)
MSQSNGEIISVEELPNSVKVFLQILLSYRVLTEKEATSALKKCEKEYDEEEQRDIFDVFSMANKNLALLDLEIKGTKISTPKETVTYFAIINTNDDEISKVHGSSLTINQLNILKSILDEFGSKDVSEPKGLDFELPTSNILSFKPDSMTLHQYKELIRQLCDDYWLIRQENGKSLKLGPKTYMELKSILDEKSIECPQILHF